MTIKELMFLVAAKEGGCQLSNAVLHKGRWEIQSVWSEQLCRVRNPYILDAVLEAAAGLVQG